jgi:hypothetical protein
VITRGDGTTAGNGGYSAAQLRAQFIAAINAIVADGVTITGSGTEADPWAVAVPYPGDPSEGGKKLQRVDTEAWEYPRPCLFGNITAFADAGDEIHVVVTFEDDMPQEGDIFNIVGSTDYNGEYTALNVDTVAKTCEIVATFTDTSIGSFSFFAPYFSPDQTQRTLEAGQYITRYYYSDLADGDIIGPVVDALCGVRFVMENSSDPLEVVYEPLRGRYFAGGESVAIAEIDGNVTVEITVVTSALAITEAWTDVIVSTGE